MGALGRWHTESIGVQHPLEGNTASVVTNPDVGSAAGGRGGGGVIVEGDAQVARTQPAPAAATAEPGVDAGPAAHHGGGGGVAPEVGVATVVEYASGSTHTSPGGTCPAHSKGVRASPAAPTVGGGEEAVGGGRHQVAGRRGRVVGQAGLAARLDLGHEQIGGRAT